MNVITAVAAAYILSGCATVAVDGTRHQQAVKPDFVLVRDFAVRPADVHLDQGVATTVELESGMLDQTDEEIRIGRAASEALAQKLVTALREAGIPAHRERDGMRPTQRTAIVAGRFVTIDEGNRTARVTLGFGLGKTEVRTRVAVYQNNQLLADADTATGSAPRPGAAVSLGTGAVAGSIATAAAGGGAAAAAGELFLSTIEADAQRTASEIAQRIIAAYEARGWLR